MAGVFSFPFLSRLLSLKDTNQKKTMKKTIKITKGTEDTTQPESFPLSHIHLWPSFLLSCSIFRHKTIKLQDEGRASGLAPSRRRDNRTAPVIRVKTDRPA